ncbi:MAG: TIGR02597 family protein [Verrucomicrobiota bacterium]
MKHTTFFKISLARYVGLVFILILSLRAQSINSSGISVGATQFNALANSDTFISIPYLRSLEYAGTVVTFSGSTLTIAGSPGWGNNDFVYDSDVQPKTYALWIRSGALEGNYYTILKNQWETVTIDLNGKSLSGLNSGDKVAIIPYWTLGTLFPSSDVGVSFVASPSAVSRTTEILIPNQQGSDLTSQYDASYYFYNNAWRQVGQSTSKSMNDVILTPDTFFIIRNHNQATSLTIGGEILNTKMSLQLNVLTAGMQDNPVALIRPVPQKLNDLGLITSGVFVASPSPVLRKDQLFVFDNGIPGLNKSPASTYYYYNGGWRKVGSPITTDFGNAVVFSSQYSMMIRKFPTNTAGTLTWKNSANY